MRLGLLSDVHANESALTAALAALRDRGADRLLVAGDLVGYGGRPNECVELLVAQGAECVAGNHDLFVLDRLPPDRFPPLARRSAEITRALLSADVRAYLDSLPLARPSGSVFMAHGAPDDPEEYVVARARARQLLGRLPLLSPGADTLVLGHTHRQWCVLAGHGSPRPQGLIALPDRPRLLNPGSVGQSRQREGRPRVRCALYDTSTATVEFLSLDYDVGASRRALRRLDLPDRCLHAPPPWRSRARRAARRFLAKSKPGGQG